MQRRARRWFVICSAMALVASTTVLIGVSIGVSIGVLIGAGTAQAAEPDPNRFTATALAPSGEPIHTPKSSSGRLAQSDPDLLGSTDSATTTVMVKLDYDAAASYTGGVAGLTATSPSITGKALSEGDPAVADYLGYADEANKAAAAAITTAVPAASVVQDYSVVYGGLAVQVPANQAKDLLAVPGVAAVQQNKLRQLDRSASQATRQAAGLPSDTAAYIGADKVWPALGGQDKAGTGVIVGVLDTGIWPEHPMLADKDLPAPPAPPGGGTRACQFGIAGDPAFSCTDKLIGAQAFLGSWFRPGASAIPDGSYCDMVAKKCSARDADGHGTHTATTAAGDRVDSAVVLGTDRGPVSGIAPGASVIAYRVCIEGCYSADSVLAVEQAIKDGVTVINFSISGGANAYSDPVELAFLDAYAAGITVSASGGNEGPGAGTANHAGPWVLTVGASTSNRAFESTLTLTASDGATYSKVGSTITGGTTGPVVKAQDVPGYPGGELCTAAFAAGSVAGKVVACKRGTNARVEKGYNAMLGGAIGMILYNPTTSDTETDNHFLPAIHLEGPNDELLAFLSAHPNVTAGWSAGTVQPTKGDVMAGFSSRGPLGDFLKPDITAPGVQILAGNTPTPLDPKAQPAGQLYQAIAGTSMSSPHTAGASALIKAAHPDWTPGQIKSAQMTSSVQDVVNADGTTAGVFDRGAGSLRVDRAVDPTVTLDVPADDYVASEADTLDRVDLNLPSINVNPLPGAIKVTRTLTNVTGRTQSITASTTSTAGLRMTVAPSTFTVPAGGSRTISVILDALQAPKGTQLTGQITLKPRSGATPAVIPVAALAGDAAITLTQGCDRATVKVGQSTACTVTATNTLPVEAKVGLQTLSPMLAQSVTSPARKSLFGASWSGTLPAAIPSKVATIEASVGPAEGYLPLSGFGFAPVPGFGDETILNFNVPQFRWGGESYTRVGVDSNGYVVVGGGTAEDNECCNPEIGSPTRPNNIIAPYWTDLSLDPGTGGGAIRVGTLTDQKTTWLVVDFDRVKVWGPDGTGVTNTFQTWIQLGAQEGVWMSYGALNGSPGNLLVSGAENRDGTSGFKLGTVVSNSEYAVQTTPPSAGGVTYAVTYRALWPGRLTVASTLQSPLLRATPIDTDTIVVTR